MAKTKEKTPQKTSPQKPECFVIMPISDRSEYPKGHFRKVYDWIFKPACEAAGYSPKLASDVKRSNLIHKDILTRLLQAPMVLCDLSNQNPNVMYELGIRQAFDKPVVLVKDIQTDTVFDTGIFRYTEYAGLEYGDVIEAVERITQAIASTTKAHESGDEDVSLIKSLSIDAADLQKVTADDVVPVLAAEIRRIGNQMRDLQTQVKRYEKSRQPRIRGLMQPLYRDERENAPGLGFGLANAMGLPAEARGTGGTFKDEPDEDV